MATSTKLFKPKNKGSHGGFDVHDQVVLKKKREGVIQYIGRVQGKKGVWFGVEITNNQIGKHSGVLDNIEYFRCRKPHKGLFVQSKSIIRVKQKSHARHKPSASHTAKPVKPRRHKRTESAPHADPTSSDKLKKRNGATSHGKKSSVPALSSPARKPLSARVSVRKLLCSWHMCVCVCVCDRRSRTPWCRWIWAP